MLVATVIGLPVVVIVSIVLTIIPPIILVVTHMEGGGWAMVSLTGDGTAVCKGYYALRFGEAEGMGVKTLQGLGMLDVSMDAVGARVQWLNGSVVQRRV